MNKQKKRPKPTRAVSLGALTTCFCHLNPLYYSVVSDAQCEKERKKERKRDYGPHSARGSAEPSVSVSLPFPIPIPFPILESSSSHPPSITYLRQRDSTPHHSIAILENPKTRPLTRYQKRNVLFFFSSKSETCTPRLAADPRYRCCTACDVSTTSYSTLLKYYYSTGTIRSGRYLLVGKVVQFDLTQNLAVRTPFSRYKTTIYLTLASLT